MKLKPLQSNILCSIHEGRETELHLPDSSDGLQPYAKIIDVGPDVKILAIGDRVIFSPANVFYKEETDGLKLVMVSEAAVFAKFVDSDPIPNN